MPTLLRLMLQREGSEACAAGRVQRASREQQDLHAQHRSILLCAVQGQACLNNQPWPKGKFVQGTSLVLERPTVAGHGHTGVQGWVPHVTRSLVTRHVKGSLEVASVGWVPVGWTYCECNYIS
jgi:hypothetical protein